jgi:antitoxin MazE
MKSSLRKVGNSVGILIPKPFLAELGLQGGDPVEIRARKGRITIEPVKRKRHAGAGGKQQSGAAAMPDPESHSR